MKNIIPIILIFILLIIFGCEKNKKKRPLKEIESEYPGKTILKLDLVGKLDIIFNPLIFQNTPIYQ